MQSLESQIYAFVVTVVMGLSVGLIFDLYKVIRGTVRPGKITSRLSDVIFWMVSTLLVFFMLLVGNWGEIRLYVFLGVALGILAYIRLLSRGVTVILQRVLLLIMNIVNFITKLLKYLWLGLTYPFILAQKTVVVPVGYLGMVYTRAVAWLKRGIRTVFQKRDPPN